MLHRQRIPLTKKEAELVDALIAQHPGKAISLTRRDPGETGPVLIHVDDDTYEADETKPFATKAAR